MIRKKTIYTENLYVYITREHRSYLEKASKLSGQTLSAYIDRLIAKDLGRKKLRNVSTTRKAA